MRKYEVIGNKYNIEFKIENGECTVRNKQNEIITKYYTIFWVVNELVIPQFTNDEKYCFISHYDKGIYCYEVLTGKVVWNRKGTRFVHIFINKDELFTLQEQKGMFVLNINDGTIEKEIKMSAIEYLFKLNDNEIFYGPHRNIFYIMNMNTKNEILTIPLKKININNCLEFAITKATKKEEIIYIKGFENHKNYLVIDLHEKVECYNRAFDIKNDFQLIDEKIWVQD